MISKNCRKIITIFIEACSFTWYDFPTQGCGLSVQSVRPVDVNSLSVSSSLLQVHIPGSDINLIYAVMKFKEIYVVMLS